MAVTAEALSDLLDTAWKTLSSRHPAHELRRVADYLDMLRGTARPPDTEPTRQLSRVMYFPGLSKGPLYDAEWLGVRRLADHWTAFAEECKTVLAAPSDITEQAGHSGDADAGVRYPITRCYFRRRFEWNPEVLRRLPATAQALQGLRVGTEVLFSRLPPGASIRRHSDGANYVGFAHLCLSENSASISIADVDYPYRAGELICFDPTFFHSVRNDGNAPRDVLLVNVWHPELTDVEIAAIGHVRAEFDALLSRITATT